MNNYFQFNLIQFNPIQPKACFKLIPYAAGVIILLMILCALWVNHIPPKAPKANPKSAKTTTTTTSAKPAKVKSPDDGTAKSATIDAEMMKRLMGEDGQLNLTPEMLKEMGIDIGMGNGNVKIMPKEEVTEEVLKEVQEQQEAAAAAGEAAKAKAAEAAAATEEAAAATEEAAAAEAEADVAAEGAGAGAGEEEEIPPDAPADPPAEEGGNSEL